MSAAEEPRLDAEAAALAEAAVRKEAEMAAEARAVLEAGGCKAIRIEGSGESWHVWCGYNPGEFFVNACSAKNPATPNDPVYLARQALATLERNEKPRARPVKAPRITDRERLIERLRAQLGASVSVAAVSAPVPVEPAQPSAHVAPEPAQEGADWTEEAPAENLEPASDLGDEFADAEFDVVSDADLSDVDFPTLDDLSEADGLALENFASAPEDEAKAEAEAAAGGPEYIFGPPADHLETLRSQRIGDVVRISRTKQGAIWALAGATENEFRDLTGQVMHDTINGRYEGPTALFERFNELQQWANRAGDVQFAERTKVAFLTNAERPAVEAFDAEADWPDPERST